jgi:putative lipase involved disintegration of autophagic bodies
MKEKLKEFGEKMDSKKELYLKRYREVTGITADQVTDEKLWQACKDTLVMSGIKVDEAVKEFGRVAQNQYPIIKKTLDKINKAFKPFSQKHL